MIKRYYQCRFLPDTPMTQRRSKTMEILDRYIDQLLEKSSPQAPVWNIEKIRH